MLRSVLRLGRVALFSGACAVAVAVAPAHAGPVLVSHYATDAAFLAALTGLGVVLPADEIAVAQARSGNNALNGDYELGLHVPPSFTNAGPVAGNTQFSWGTAGGANPAVAFSLSRVGNTLTFAMGNYVGSYTNAAVSSLNSLAFRARSNAGSTNSTVVQNLLFNGTPLAGGSLLAQNGAIDIALYTGVTGNFALTGAAALNWTAGAFPTGSRLGFQIKAFTADVVPAPGALALLGFGLLVLMTRERRRV